jgi:hypothetical protein
LFWITLCMNRKTYNKRVKERTYLRFTYQLSYINLFQYSFLIIFLDFQLFYPLFFIVFWKSNQSETNVSQDEKIFNQLKSYISTKYSWHLFLRLLISCCNHLTWTNLISWFTLFFMILKSSMRNSKFSFECHDCWFSKYIFSWFSLNVSFSYLLRQMMKAYQIIRFIFWINLINWSISFGIWKTICCNQFLIVYLLMIDQILKETFVKFRCKQSFLYIIFIQNLN